MVTPSWRATLPLLLQSLRALPNTQATNEALEELRRAAEALDAWGKRHAALLELLEQARDFIDEDEYKTARESIARALVLLGRED